MSSRFDHGDHTVIVHSDQLSAENLESMARAAEEAGFDYICDEQGVCVYGLTEEQANTLSDGLHQMGINPYGGVSY